MPPVIKFEFHPQQRVVFDSPARYKVVLAGRRWGKNYLVAREMVREAIKGTKPGALIAYIHPLRIVAKRLMWEPLKELLFPFIKSKNEADLVIRCKNGATVALFGSDKNLDNLRGISLAFMAFDEFDYSSWEPWEVLRPALRDNKGKAYFISTPGTEPNLKRLQSTFGTNPEWAFWTFPSLGNPFLDSEDIEKDKEDMPLWLWEREYLGVYTDTTTSLCPSEWWKTISELPHPGDWLKVWTVSDPSFGKSDLSDPAGIMTGIKWRDRSTMRDRIVIADVVNRRLKFPELEEQMLAVFSRWSPETMGIEDDNGQGTSLLQAFDGSGLPVHPLLPNNRSKGSRFARVTKLIKNADCVLLKADWNPELIRQCDRWPKYEHDELVDCVAYLLKDEVSPQVSDPRYSIVGRPPSAPMTKGNPFPDEEAEGPFILTPTRLKQGREEYLDAIRRYSP